MQVEDKQEAKPAADFCADSARAFVVEQCAFGPRVPGSEAHRLCGDYLAGKLRQYGASVIEQRMSLTTFDGTMIPARNIIGEYNPDASRRLLLLAHWDCRPWADNDPDPARRRDPVPGANDGASGVAVLLEVARQLAAAKPSIGVDILLVDAEDWGDSGAGNDAGRPIRTVPATAPCMAYCSTWWVRVAQYLPVSISRPTMPEGLSTRFGKRPGRPATATTLSTLRAVP